MNAIQYLEEVRDLRAAEASAVVTNDMGHHGVHSFQGIYYDLACIKAASAAGKPYTIRPHALDKALERVDTRLDCADFVVPALIMLLKEYAGTEYLSKEDQARIEKSLINFKYWLDEPGEVHACFFTENHQILYHGEEHVIGAMFPDTVFPNNGMTGKEHSKHGETFLRRWLTWRSRFGFAEWLTQGYYLEDILGLIPLMLYAEDEDVRKKSRILIDLLVFDMAIHGFYGHLPTTHGRVYTAFIIEPDNEDCSHMMRLLFGEGSTTGISSATILLACSGYQCPEAILEAYRDKRSFNIRERMSVDAADAIRYGIDGKDFDNIMFFWGMQTYSDRVCIDNSLKVFPTWNWMTNRVKAYKERYVLCDEAGAPCPDAPDFTAMTQADIFTRKTKDYILSSVQDFRKGKMGYQQHPWTASLGGRAVIFTTNPASTEYGNRPNRWAGNLTLPRCVQNNNVMFCIYRVLPDFVDFLNSHLYFPTHEMDEVVEEKGFIFGRKGDGYIAVTAIEPGYWETKDEAMFRFVYPDNSAEMYERAGKYEYVVQGHANVWAVEMGSKDENGSFEAFRAAFTENALSGDTHAFSYVSPSQGRMTCGWGKELVIENEPVRIHDYKRYDCPFCDAEFDTDCIRIQAGGKTLTLNMTTGDREEGES